MPHDLSGKPQYRAIDFEELDWESPAPGARHKVFRRDGKQLRLVEFTSDFIEPHWCEKGHAGIVLSGELEVEFRHHGTHRYPEGSGLFIQAGPEHGHKARAATPAVRLFLVEDV